MSTTYFAVCGHSHCMSDDIEYMKRWGEEVSTPESPAMIYRGELFLVIKPSAPLQENNDGQEAE